MSQVWINIALVLFFILLGSFFAAAEIALVSLRESQVERLSQRGRRGRTLASLVSNPNRFLAAVQVGVTLAGFISAGFGAAQIAPALAPVLESWGLSEGWASVSEIRRLEDLAPIDDPSANAYRQPLAQADAAIASAQQKANVYSALISAGMDPAEAKRIAKL